MKRFYLRVALRMCLVFVVPMFLIHAQPYDDHELRTLLMPEGCPMPCFMGIQPGVTTVDEALKILKASGWVTNLEYETPIIRWKWTGKEPEFLDTDLPQYFEVEDNKVRFGWIYINASFAEVLIATSGGMIGSKEFGLLARPDSFVWQFTHIIHSRYGRLGVVLDVYCDNWDILRSPTSILISNKYSQPEDPIQFHELRQRQQELCD